MDVVALAGGVGAARFLRGLVEVVPGDRLTVVTNTGDDFSCYGLHVSPDLDSITYTLGRGADEQRGWGRADESLRVAGELRDRYGEPDWFSLGDLDLATHLVRTRALREGATLTEVTATVARAWGLDFRLLPMTDDPVATRIRTQDGRVLHFQEWWVRERAEPPVAEVWLDGAEAARPAPGVLDAITAADVVVVCPSNPVVSIGTILAVPGIREALAKVSVVGISPIVGGRVVRGMADRLLPVSGVPVSASGVADLYADFLDGWVIDVADAGVAGEFTHEGLAIAVTDTIMRDVEVTAALARTAIALVAP